jgi:Ca2+-binding EF-hand superfamily protein
MYNINDVLNSDKLFDFVSKKTFDAVDSDFSGRITEDELILILRSIAEDLGFERPTVEETHKILKKIDEDNSGSIEYSEFRKLFKKLLQIMDDVTEYK